LDDLSPFRAVPANWRVAGGAESDPLVREHLSATPGTGVLVNQPAPAVGENLFTVMEHGDLELELEFPASMPAGGKRITPRFLRVEHNGVLVQENVQVTGPTRAAAFEDERPLGPLSSRR
jgi:hypothetical protein